MNAASRHEGCERGPHAAEPPGRAREVVVVDDDEGARRYLERILRRAGFRVRALSDPWEALAVCDRLGPPVILVDIRMPQMDGRTLVEELHRRMGANAPRVIFVSSVVREVELPALPLVVEAFEKMPTREVLVRAVRRYARGHFASGPIPKPDQGSRDED